MLLSFVVLLDLMEVSIFYIYFLCTLNLLQYWSTITQARCLEMVDVRLFIIFYAVGVNQILKHVPKEHTQIPIALEAPLQII